MKLREQVPKRWREAKQPQLYRIVLAGGRCGGKTTALAEIKARLEALGFLILCLPEVATLLFGGGAFPYDDDTTIAFQKNLLGFSSRSRRPWRTSPTRVEGNGACC